jgi:dihydropteroate synthase
MKAGIENNIDIINDVSGLRYSNKSIDIIKQKKIPFVLMHSIKNPKTMQSNIDYDDVLLDVYDFFKKKIALCESKRIDKKSIILDPGIGFGKTVKQNLNLITNIALLHSLGCPVLFGSSRKSFIGKLHKNALEEKRMGGSIATVIHALNQGVQIFRVHDVFETSQAIKIYKKL